MTVNIKAMLSWSDNLLILFLVRLRPLIIGQPEFSVHTFACLWQMLVLDQLNGKAFNDQAPISGEVTWLVWDSNSLPLHLSLFFFLTYLWWMIYHKSLTDVECDGCYVGGEWHLSSFWVIVCFSQRKGEKEKKRHHQRRSEETETECGKLELQSGIRWK